MKMQSLPIIAIVVSLIAIAISLATRDQGTADQRAAIESLERRLRLLESGTAGSREHGDGGGLSGLAIDTDAIVAADPSGAGDSGGVDVLRAEQARLENQLAELGVFEFFEEKRLAVDRSYTLVLDPEANSKDRLEALGVLRKADRIDDEVVSSMVGLWEQSLGQEEGGWTRWFLMENLEGVESAEFRDSILSWIPEEQSPKMRARAIETLGGMLPDQTVDEWLVYLAENDPEPKLREQAIATRAAAAREEK